MITPAPPSTRAVPLKAQGFSIEEAISTVLRIGVLLSLLLLVSGTGLSFLQSGGCGTTAEGLQHLTHPAAGFPRTFAWFLHGLGHLDGQALVATGLLLLIVTPVLRVAISIGLFAAQKDRTYVLLTVIVLALLLLSFVLGKVG